MRQSFVLRLLAALLLLGTVAPRVAHADGVTTCTDPSAVNTTVMDCLDNLVYQPLPIDPSTLVLVCPNGSPGLQDQSQCPGNVWQPLSSLASNALVGYCAQAQLTPYQVCNYPDGNEGYRFYSDIFAAGTPTAPGVAQISWSAPQVTQGGDPISPVTGYIILYGMTDFSSAVSIPATTSYTFRNLTPGLWQFQVITQTADGNSPPSNAVTVTVSGWVGLPASPVPPVVSILRSPAWHPAPLRKDRTQG